MSLVGKRTLITGAGRGIGRAIAQICAKEGASVAICARTSSELEETLSSLPSHIPKDMYVIDLKDEGQVEDMVDQIVEKWGGIDILINNAGRGSNKGKVTELASSELRDILDLNIVSVHSITSVVLRKAMLKRKQQQQQQQQQQTSSGGRIINISSRAAKIGIPQMSFYVASKFALEGYSSVLAHELKDDNIIVNTISPGKVDTSSFPKSKGSVGVRTADSIKDGLMLLLQTEKTGHYLHVDELDMVREKGLDDSFALKPIDEPTFVV
jgi:NAD(P)-dependent dehydrogenase (short-subunit alcohol dehydrogenase family)